MRLVFFTGFLLFSFFESDGQLDSLTHVVLKKILSSEEISKKVFTDQWKQRRAAFIYFTKAIINHVNNIDEILIKMNPEFGSLTPLFQVGIDSVYLFRDPIALGVHSNFKIDKVIVVEKLSIKNNMAKVSFSTTNLHSEKFHNNAFDQFCAQIELEFGRNNIEIRKTKLKTNCSFKSIL